MEHIYLPVILFFSKESNSDFANFFGLLVLFLQFLLSITILAFEFEFIVVLLPILSEIFFSDEFEVEDIEMLLSFSFSFSTSFFKHSRTSSGIFAFFIKNNMHCL